LAPEFAAAKAFVGFGRHYARWQRNK
jgi:hypothetical protein